MLKYAKGFYRSQPAKKPFCKNLQKGLSGILAICKAMVIKSKAIVRNGVRGHEVFVAPRKGYTRFVPANYKKPMAR